ncbi:hypothetical protein Bbelb_123450 [Branchiostoma belcheri]|nr:hypothetical protein Bbelb_123450 [Branchiostoma belcheri]
MAVMSDYITPCRDPYVCMEHVFIKITDISETRSGFTLSRRDYRTRCGEIQDYVNSVLASRALCNKAPRREIEANIINIYNCVSTSVSTLMYVTVKLTLQPHNILMTLQANNSTDTYVWAWEGVTLDGDRDNTDSTLPSPIAVPVPISPAPATQPSQDVAVIPPPSPAA